MDFKQCHLRSEPRPLLAQKVCLMPDPIPPNVKIYDRPERKGPSPLLLGIALIVILLVGFLLFKTFSHQIAPSVKPPVGLVPIAVTTSGFVPLSGTFFQRR